MNITYEIYSGIGNRELNEDNAGVKKENDCLVAVVADGLGGHEKGEVASQLVTDAILESVSMQAEGKEELHRVMLEAHQVLREYQRMEQTENSMKTTVVALYLKDQKAYIGHVGDSRGYVFYKNKEWIRTRDHSVTHMLYQAGEIKEKHIRHHEDRNKLLKVFGSEWAKDACEFLPCIDVTETKAFLLCSDGFWENITERQMMKCLKKSSTPQEWMEKMLAIVKKAEKSGEMDNYTAVAVFCQ